MNFKRNKDPKDPLKLGRWKERLLEREIPHITQALLKKHSLAGFLPIDFGRDLLVDEDGIISLGLMTDEGEDQGVSCPVVIWDPDKKFFLGLGFTNNILNYDEIENYYESAP